MPTRTQLLDEAQQIAHTAIRDNRDLTTTEKNRIDLLLKQVHDVDNGPTPDLFDRLMGRVGTTDSGSRFLAPASKAAASIAAAIDKARPHNATLGRKALLVAGDLYADVPTLAADPIQQPRPPTSLLDAIPVTQVTAPTFTYLRQTTRTNNAAPVAPFGLKPTSIYGLTQYDGKLRVFAHVSEPFDEFWVADAPGLARFLEAEMVYGLRAALEASVLNGTGVDPNMRGIALTSGIQVQAWDTSTFTTTRKAVTKVETLGFAPRMFVMAASDWEAMELAAFTSGNYVLNAEGSGNLPVDAAARRLWGVPVVLSTAQAAGGAYLISGGTVELVTDGRLLVQTSNATGDDFSHNQLRMRVEARYELAVTSPSGIVAVDLAV